MIRHCILWKIESENPNAVKADAKTALEGLVGKIDGLVKLRILTNPLEKSSADMMLDSTFESTEALEAYKTHPLHVKAADTYVRPYAKVRLSFDFEE